MNFLQLVQRLHTETGRQGDAPDAVTGQTGMNARLVNWILQADQEVQTLHESWLFRVGEFSKPTVASTQNYAPADWSITDLAAWKFDPDINNLSGIRIYSSESDETDLVYLPWDDFRATYKFGSSRTQTGRPSIFSIKPDNSIDLWQIPNAVFTVNGEYIKQAVAMTGDTDEPPYPSDYHMIVVAKAMMFYGAYEGADEIYSDGEGKYNTLLSRLEFNQLPKIQWGPSLV